MSACKVLTASILSAAAIAATASMAMAQTPGPFDGTWSIEMPAAGTAYQTSAATCPALQMNVEIKDSKVIGSLERAPTTALVVKPGEGPASAPVTGVVRANGDVTARWMNYHASGMLSGDSGKITVKGDQCGLRDGIVKRVSK
jgi:hypothetical protein